MTTVARENGFDADAVCQSLFNCPLEEVSKKAASLLIDHLKRKVADAPAEEMVADASF